MGWAELEEADLEEEPAEEEELGCQRTGRWPSATQESRTTSSQSFTLTFDSAGWHDTKLPRMH